jgi:hypothetical protein
MLNIRKLQLEYRIHMAIREGGFDITEVVRRGRWYKVRTPKGEEAAFLWQSQGILHYFAKETPFFQTCWEGEFGDDGPSDEEFAEYKRLLLNVPKELHSYQGVSSAMGQVSERHLL